jgi:hypothetical protein
VSSTNHDSFERSLVMTYVQAMEWFLVHNESFKQCDVDNDKRYKLILEG